jgi:hypothetical protein
MFILFPINNRFKGDEDNLWVGLGRPILELQHPYSDIRTAEEPNNYSKIQNKR